MRKHSVDMTAAWAKDWDIKGYEQLDPVVREKRRQEAVNDYNKHKFEKQNKQQYNNH
jgi:hypothetical protein